jgi:type I restriction-modification system DNA methylase subunit
MANALFSAKDFKPELLATFYQSIPQLDDKKQVIRNWQKAIENGKVQKSKEEQIKSEFLDKFFGQVLGYTYESHEAEWNLEKEFKSISDGKKPDAALGFFDQQNKTDVRCVIEVKGALINLDKKQNRADFAGSSVDQAFNYVPRMPGKCEWVIVTNMIEIRLYSRSDISRYETFLIPELLQPNNLQRFFFLLSYNQLFLERGSSRIDQLYSNKQADQKKIGAEFYRQYRDIRQILFANLFKENPTVKPKDLFRVTQKLIDRLIFIGFVRDLRLVDNVLTELNQNIKTSFRKDNQKGWGELKELFIALNEGYTERNIPPFNGELFKPDALLDHLVVRDHQIMPLVKLVQDYDFQSQLDVNILGHIFEQSIADLPEILDEIQKKTPLELTEPTPETTTVAKRKKDGIFYTPEYITQYMVKEAVGGWLEDRKKEILESLHITELPEPEFADYATIKVVNEKVEANHTILLNLTFWQAYEQKLASIKVVDPACGSGAFLNAVFDFLYNEWAKVLKPELKKLTTPLNKQMLENSTVNEPLAFTYGGDEEWRIKKNIILHNIFGVDLNGESVEITKLSLWLKTANKTNSLAALYDNIKQGNSLIDDTTVAGDDAFNWHHAFADIMQAGGFDVVVGNPPYVPTELIGDNEKLFYKNEFPFLDRKYDTSTLFISRCLSLLNKIGKLTFISSTTWQTGENYNELRRSLFTSHGLRKIINLPFDVFEEAYVETCIYIFTRNISESYQIFSFPKKADVKDLNNIQFDKVFIKDLDSNYKIIAPSVLNISEKISKIETISFGEISKSTQGLAGNKYERKAKSFDDAYPFLEEGQLLRYQFSIEELTYVSLEEHKSLKEYYRAEPKILIRRIISRQDRINVSYSDSKLLFTKDINPFIIIDNRFDTKFVLSLIASKLISYLYLNRSSVAVKDDFRQTTLTELRNLRIPIVSKKDQQPFITLAEKMLALNKSVSERSQKFIELLQSNFVFEPTTKLKKWYALEFIDLLVELEKGGAKLPPKKQGEWLELFKQEKGKIQHTQAEIATTDKEIDQLVYQLYNLTPEEIEIVEKSN